MHDLKFLDVGLLDEPDHDSSAFLPCVAKVYDNFISTMGLAVGLKALPGFVAWVSKAWLVASSNATVEVMAMKPKTAWKYNKLHTRQTFRNMKPAMSLDGPELRAQIKEWTEIVERTILITEGHVHGLFHGIFKSMVIQAWTAMEALIEDTFLIVEENNPSLLRLPVPAQKGNISRGFGSRIKFRYTYDYAFYNDPGINSALAHESIDALVLLRNVLIHSAGIADSDLLKPGQYGANNILQKHLPGLVLDREIFLDGTAVRGILEPCLMQARVFSVAVDTWLRLHGVTS